MGAMPADKKWLTRAVTHECAVKSALRHQYPLSQNVSYGVVFGHPRPLFLLQARSGCANLKVKISLAWGTIMGQQQLLLLTLGVILVSIATSVGMTMFVDNAGNMNRDAVSNDLMYYATRAMQHYRKPVQSGGGGNSFAGLTTKHLANKVDANGFIQNANGTYQIVGTPGGNNPLQIKGIGKEIGYDGKNKLSLVIKVWTDSVHIDMTNGATN